MLMLDCWELDPEDRPTFSKLVKDIESYLTESAGYLDFNKFPHSSEDDDDDSDADDSDADDIDAENDQGSEIQEETITLSFDTDNGDK